MSKDSSAALEPAAVAADPSLDSILPMEEEVRRILRRALELTRWNVREAASRLGIGRATMYRKIERYKLTRDLR